MQPRSLYLIGKIQEKAFMIGQSQTTIPIPTRSTLLEDSHTVKQPSDEDTHRGFIKEPTEERLDKALNAFEYVDKKLDIAKNSN